MIRKSINKTLRITFYLSLLVSLTGLSAALGENIEIGKKLFEGKCARCHGMDGKGNKKMVKILKVSIKKVNLHRKEIGRMSVYQIEELVDSGKHRMPKYRGKLTDSEIHDVAQYVKFLAGNESQNLTEPSRKVEHRDSQEEKK